MMYGDRKEAKPIFGKKRIHNDSQPNTPHFLSQKHV